MDYLGFLVVDVSSTEGDKRLKVFVTLICMFVMGLESSVSRQ